ncbi:imm11 family protein [Flavobacterium sp. B183]|uniref:imm11 family protein n=1 Tax=Flavobacterium sp. B183 TaxID=907046 RepID=UPI003531D767
MYRSKKKQDNRRLDFDASCYYTGILLINEKNRNLLANKLSEKIEILDVETDLSEKFYFVNLLTKIDCINKDNKSNSDIMLMVRENNISFKKNNISDNIIFRDDKLSSSYFCTNEFVNFIAENDIKGLRFEKVGIAE